MYKQATITPPEGRPSQIHHRSPASSPPAPGLPSPPSDTQVFSQFVYPPNALANEVEDEEAEGVWGYLIPLDNKFGDTLVLRKRTFCPAPEEPLEIIRKVGSKSKKGKWKENLAKNEDDYERNKQRKGFPASGYLIGRHPECG
jgi:serine/threonine-protein kinase CHEK2